MAVRKPLVLVNGEIQQLQPTDSLSGPFTEVDTVVLFNDDIVDHILGDIVYITAADHCKKAKADAPATKGAIAFAMGAVITLLSGNYQTAGILGGLVGLTPGAVYYLDDANAGKMITPFPAIPTAGHYVVRLGTAISATELLIEIERPILL